MAKVLKCLHFMHSVRRGQEEERRNEAKVLGKRVREVLSAKVSMLTIVLVLGVPLFALGRYPEEDLSMKAYGRRLEGTYSQAYDSLASGIAADVNEIIDGLLDLDIDSYLIPLENHVNAAVLKVQGFLGDMKSHCSEAKESLDRFLRDDLAKGKEYAKEKAEAIFGDLTPLIGDFNEIYTSIVKPLILELVKAIKAIYEAAKRLQIPLDAPDSVAEESIDRARCSWRQTRWFKSIEDYNVDIESTMVCDTVKTLGRWFKCRCVGTEDCYVPRKFRPDPTDSRRCFKTD